MNEIEQTKPELKKHILTPSGPLEFFEFKDGLEKAERGIEKGQLPLFQNGLGIYAQINSNGHREEKILLLQFFTRSLSAGSRKIYQLELMNFFDFLKDHNFSTDEREILTIHFIAYRDFLIQRNYANKTILRRLSIVTSYFNYLVENNVLEKNRCVLSQREKPVDNVFVRPTNALTDDEVNKILEAAKNHHPNIFQRKFHHAILTLLLYTGLRKSELINLKGQNLIKTDGITLLSVIGKGGKQREIPLVDDALSAINGYLEGMREQGREVKNSDYLFQPQLNCDPNFDLRRNISKSIIDDLCKYYSKLTGIEKRISAHSMRATTITNLREQGADIYGIAELAGHSSTETTKKYIKRSEKLKNSVVFKLKF